MLDADGDVLGETRYYAFGETRYSSGSMIADRLFTGQRAMLDLGIYHYDVRFYSQTLGRFLSADTVVPGGLNSQAYDRYAYVMNSPIVYSDPSGHVGQAPCIPGINCAGNVMWSYPNNDFEAFYEIGSAILCAALNCTVDITQNQVIANGPSDVILIIVPDVVVPILPAPEIAKESQGGVYSLIDDETNQIMRTGRSQNLTTRERQHARDPILREYTFQEEARTDNYFEQRGLEQMLHEKYNPPLNKINPIRSNNTQREAYLKAAKDFLKRHKLQW